MDADRVPEIVLERLLQRIAAAQRLLSYHGTH
jgi:hypothetical protein